MKVTKTDVEQILALKWDVDIEKDACDLILPEITELALQLRNKEQAILKFFFDMIGKPAFVDNQDGFVASEFVQKHGKNLKIEHLPDKKWKTFDEIPLPPARERTRRNQVRVKPSENLLKLNDILKKSGCQQLNIEKFQMQLGIIADSGIDLDDIEVQTNEHQTIFSIKNGVKILTVDLIPARCAIRLFGNTPTQKIYAHKDQDVISAMNWLKQ